MAGMRDLRQVFSRAQASSRSDGEMNEASEDAVAGPAAASAEPKVHGLKRSLSARHLSFISLGGTLGTGLFISAGTSLATAGPGGALVAYAFLGGIVFFLMSSLGEMATFIPIAGSFNEYSSRFADPAIGFALGWNYWFNYVCVTASELVAAGIVMRNYLPHVNGVVWSVTAAAILLGLNLFSVRGYAEAEFWFAAIKVVTVIVFIVIGIVVAAGGLGHHTYGVENWKIEGAPFHDGMPGVLATLVLTGYAFQGTEVVGIIAGEAADPVRTVPKAIRQVFWRILLFYVSCIFIIGLIIPYNDPSLVNASTENIGQSPFTMVFSKAGLKPAADVMNAIILTTVLSAGNSCIYIATRTLWNLAMHGQAPAVFRKVTKSGIPIYSLALSLGIATAVFLLSLIGNQVVYTWILSLAGVTGFVSWLGIAFSHIRFRSAYVRQGYDVNDLPYRSVLYPYGPALCLVVITAIVFGQGWTSFAGGTFHVETFVTSYVSLPVTIGLYLFWKLWKRTKWVRLEDADVLKDSIFDRESDVFAAGRNSREPQMLAVDSYESVVSVATGVNLGAARILFAALALGSAVLAGKFSPKADEFKLNDELKVECAQLGEQGGELSNADGSLRWISPTCVETRKPLSLYYGRDGPIQCSVKAEDTFHETMLRSITHDRALRCRVARNKLAYAQYMELSVRVEGVRVRGAGGGKSAAMRRISGNFNAVLHGLQGNLVAGSVYPVMDQPLPETVSGVTTMQFNQKWYEGTGLSVLMANKRHEEQFVIEPVVAIMFCILTACIVYVVGRVYVEGSLIPRAIKEHRDEKEKAARELLLDAQATTASSDNKKTK
ncbi:hypothetical protein GGI21_000242 [Coemansia aciculifera]|nr:hypothetical protein GGI21_000242 [Coemansia aciculifera]